MDEAHIAHDIDDDKDSIANWAQGIPHIAPASPVGRRTQHEATRHDEYVAFM